ncbi:cytochrome oxidase assembly protein 1 [Amphichorda felina]
MLSRVLRRRLVASLRAKQTPRGNLQRRWITPAPRPGDGPLMSRRADRELPNVEQVSFRWRRTLPIFMAIVAACSVAIFNYQKMSSPVIASTLYALRTSPRARAILGDDIYFNHQIPWIHGQMNQLQGRIDIWFTVRGTRGVATMRFASNRPTPRGMFETTEWSLKTEDGEWIDLLEGGDPFKVLLGDDDAIPMPAIAAPELEAEEDDRTKRGFRQQKPLGR